MRRLKITVLGYVDPGSGSMVAQIAVAGAAGAAVAVKMAWRKATARRRVRGGQRGDEVASER